MKWTDTIQIAEALFDAHPDIAVAYIDVVMETVTRRLASRHREGEGLGQRVVAALVDHGEGHAIEHGARAGCVAQGVCLRCTLLGRGFRLHIAAA